MRISRALRPTAAVIVFAALRCVLAAQSENVPKTPSAESGPKLAVFALRPDQAGAKGSEIDDLSMELLRVRRVYVDRLTGGETAAQMRELIISSLQGTRLFVITENQERADAFLRGAAEDLIYTDQLISSEGTSAHENGTEIRGSTRARLGTTFGLSGSENESTNIKERKHEAMATVRLVNKVGDVIWATTQESNGAKFRGSSADVAEKITRQLMSDMEKLRRPRAK